METSRIKVRTLFVSIVAIISVELAAWFVAPKIEFLPVAILGVARLIEIFLIIWIVQNWERGTSSVGLERPRLLHGIRRGLIWSAGFGGMIALATLFLLILAIDPSTFFQTDLPSRSIEVLIYFLVVGVVGPVAEEIFFRGILFGFFRRWGFWLAFFLSVLLFAIAHPGFPRVSFSQIIGGITFTGSYEVEKNLMVPIVIHILGNLAILVFC